VLNEVPDVPHHEEVMGVDLWFHLFLNSAFENSMPWSQMVIQCSPQGSHVLLQFAIVGMCITECIDCYYSPLLFF
jgi:hypothetical protein